MKKITVLLLIMISVLCLPANAYTMGMNAKGWDWNEFSQPEKQRMIQIIYSDYGVDQREFTIKSGIDALETYYADLKKKYQQNPTKSKYSYYMNMRISDLLGKMLNNSFKQ